jgi:hypothetical protein
MNRTLTIQHYTGLMLSGCDVTPEQNTIAFHNFYDSFSVEQQGSYDKAVKTARSFVGLCVLSEHTRSYWITSYDGVIEPALPASSMPLLTKRIGNQVSYNLDYTYEITSESAQAARAIPASVKLFGQQLTVMQKRIKCPVIERCMQELHKKLGYAVCENVTEKDLIP